MVVRLEKRLRGFETQVFGEPCMHMVLITDLVKASKTIDVFYNVCLFSIIALLLKVWRKFSVL